MALDLTENARFPGEASADLHLHSNRSDGCYTPAEVVGRAARMGVRVVSITDHDTTAGTWEASLAAEAHGLDFVSGVELSASSRGRVVHVLGYFVAPEAPSLLAHGSDLRVLRRDRIAGILDRLCVLGVPLEMTDVEAIAGDAMPGRPHVARALVQRGHAGSSSQAFRRWLRDDGPAVVPLAAPEIALVLERIHAAGGVAVIAHPSSSRASEEEVETFRELGLDGIESCHSDQTAAERRCWSALARRLDMVESGGSDDHGFSNRRSVGAHSIPIAWVDRLRARRTS